MEDYQQRQIKERDSKIERLEWDIERHISREERSRNIFLWTLIGLFGVGFIISTSLSAHVYWPISVVGISLLIAPFILMNL